MTGVRTFCLLAAAAFGALGAGCGQSTDAGSDARVDITAVPAKPRVVVAVIDGGINPYHSIFNEDRPGLESRFYPRGAPPSAVTPDVLAEFGIDGDHILTLTRTGNPEADYAADAAQWARVKLGEAYWFRGTNIIAVGRDQAGPPILPDSDSDAHGMGVTAAVLAANPEAIIFFVEQEQGDITEAGTSNDAGSSAAHAVGFLHPAVDIVSTSYGLAGNLPEAKAWYHTFDSVVGLGKLHFSAAGSDPPTVAALGGGSGPWWSIGVTAIYEDDGHADEQNVRDWFGSYFADFVADFEQTFPYCSICQVGGEDLQRGTSLSAPRAAGVASKVLLEARRRLGHSGGIEFVDSKPFMVSGAGRAISNWQLRRALEQAAHVPTMEGYDPLKWPQPPTGIPVIEAAPWLLVGWGELSADPQKQVITAALAELGLQGGPRREKEPGFCDFQTTLIEARHAWWDRVAPLADRVPDTEIYGGDGMEPPAEDPFIYCGSDPQDA